MKLNPKQLSGEAILVYVWVVVTILAIGMDLLARTMK